MNRKLISIIVCMLLIVTTGTVFADWEPNDGHKMHFPQTPKTDGWTIDFGDGYLADDWQCSETGPVNEIHFWIAWRQDISTDIPYIYVAIYSNGSSGYFPQPQVLLWERTFSSNQFTVAGPWSCDHGWYTPGPGGGYYENDHTEYYQINIKNIQDPFAQQKNTVYWLVIQMPDLSPMEIGWVQATPPFYYGGYGVYGEPGAWWPLIDPIYGFDLSFVINYKEPGPDLHCNGSLYWSGVIPGSAVSGDFWVGNNGPAGSLLNWQVANYPPWGTWTFSPSYGYNLPAGSWQTVTATCIAPNQANTKFTGKILLENIDEPTDNCTIPIYLRTPKTRDIQYKLLFERLIERFPLFYFILQKILRY